MRDVRYSCMTTLSSSTVILGITCIDGQETGEASDLLNITVACLYTIGVYLGFWGEVMTDGHMTLKV